MLRVGLTGGIASGKSTVAEVLHERGALVIDADVLARLVVEPGTPGLAALVDRFGRTILRADGSLDRPALAERIFSDPVARADAEGIIHPAVRAAAARLEAAAASDAVVVHVIPLLVETGQRDAFDVVVVVDAPEELQRERLLRRNGLSTQEADARIAAQATRAARLAAADLVIDNDGSVEELRARAEVLWARLEAAR